MSKKTKILILFIPSIIILFIAFGVFGPRFWAQAQVVCPEVEISFTESFDNTNFKDEANSKVTHWGEGYIKSSLAGILQTIPRTMGFSTWVNVTGIGDFDRDGLVDFVGTVDSQCKRIVFIKNTGSSDPATKFQELGDIWNPSGCSGKYNSLLGGDFNNDGYDDFMYVVSKCAAGSNPCGLDKFYFFENKHTVNAQGIPQFTIRDYTTALGSNLAVNNEVSHVTCDFDKDGDLDILWANVDGKVYLIKNNGTKPLSDTTKFSKSVLINATTGESGGRWGREGINAIGYGDFDLDGDNDIIIGAINWRGIKYYKNDGTGNYTFYKNLGDTRDMGSSTTTYPDDDLYDGACAALAVADFDMDGDLDFMVGTDNWLRQETTPYWPNLTDQPTNCPSPIPAKYEPGNTLGGRVFYFKNDGKGEFISKLIFNGYQLRANGECAPWDFDVGLAMDFDEDGDMDCLMFDGNHSLFYHYFENRISNLWTQQAYGVSTNVTVASFPGGLSPDNFSITKVQISAIDQSVDGVSTGLKATYYVSNDGGRSWELYQEFSGSDIKNYTNLPVHTFSGFGSDLRWKVVMSCPDDYPDPASEYHGTSNDSPRVDRIEMKYFYVEKQEYSRSSVTASIIDKDNSSHGLIIAGTFIYPGWNGHLRAYDVTNMTAINTSYSVLRTVTRPDLSTVSGREIVPEGVEILWDAGELLRSRAASDRTIYTAVPSGDRLSRLDFTAANVDTLEPLLSDYNNDNAGLINFVRGEGRTWKLGDSNHSNPIVVGPPSGEPSRKGEGYQDFMNTWKGRAEVLYVGANDGMLHCFDVLTGRELWGYIPYNLLPRLNEMWAVDATTGTRYFNRNMYVDGSPQVEDIYIDSNGDGIKEWITILICGQGPGFGSSIAGGKNYYFALDVTDPNIPKPLWEFTDSAMGETWSMPAIGKVVKNGSEAWVGFVGSGYDNDDSNVVGNRFYALDLETGTSFWSFTDSGVDTRTEHGFSWDIQNAFVGSPSAIDIDQDGRVDRVYFVDLDGRVWRAYVSLNFQDESSGR